MKYIILILVAIITNSCTNMESMVGTDLARENHNVETVVTIPEIVRDTIVVVTALENSERTNVIITGENGRVIEHSIFQDDYLLSTKRYDSKGVLCMSGEYSMVNGLYTYKIEGYCFGSER